MPTKATEKELQKFMKGLRKRNQGETEFHQVVEDLACSVMPIVLDNEDYRKAQILERMTEPDRIITFRVSWEDDSGCIRANRAWRVQFNRAIGPYKGGLRFHPSVNQSILKFLGFEQCFKNSLTGLPMGGGKGGSNFNPKGKSEREVMRFCQSMMTELARHIGPQTDVPAGDIGVGSREIGFLFGHYTRLTNQFEGVLTGKGLSFGGSAVRSEATGYGCIYFADHVLEHAGEKLKGKKIAISGSGNVAIYAAEKALELGASVISLSDSDGTAYAAEGISEEQLEFAKKLKFEQRGRISELADEFASIDFTAGAKPWDLECDIALPCATQNELDEDDARTLAKNGVIAVVEGANMPCTSEAHDVLRERGVLFAPAKAANAGGVAVSGLEMTQNSMRIGWSREEVDMRLKDIMSEIHGKCIEQHDGNGAVDYANAANVAGFMKVADAMLAYGVV